MAEPAEQTLALTVNGTRRELLIPPRRTLVEVLREDLGLCGTKVGCGQGECGACTVLVDGEPLLSCLLLALELDGASITTIEGLASAPGAGLSALPAAFVAQAGLQCGFCTPGMIMAATAIAPHAGRASMRAALAGNLCRCTGYSKILAAIEAAG